ncbi:MULTISPECIES: hypothetical protein [Butyricimonas]|uniref:hypothetical protein n=1 Tax=Butyricimonas TaxID=574697 RepID=UPI001D080E0F|nr:MULTISPECIES: hypothetical protein [Butyricimonas]MCB6971817.1 hypothetical protein [Butyricimonas synergistica]MCG4518825.1 hypothetical protein [Butyricimonas sp. DFI.6.44]
MKTITVEPNQTVFDLAIQYYGTTEGINEILEDNTLENDDTSKIATGIDPVSDKDFYIDLPVKPGTTIIINTGSKLVKNSVTRDITTSVTTFNL